MKQQQTMVMQPNQPMVAYGEVPVLETDTRSSGFSYAATVINFLRCGCPAVQFMYSNLQESAQTEFVENIKAGLQRLCLPRESTGLVITTQDDKGIVVLITHSIPSPESS